MATEVPGEPASFVIVVFDSLRFDSAAAAAMPNLARLGQLERRWSYASWTAPSHYNLLMGLLPHASPERVYASEYYRQDMARYAERLSMPGMEFKAMLPSLYLPTYLRSQGYHTAARVSMPVLNPHVPLNHDFDDYRLMPRHNDFDAILDEVVFADGKPSFHMLNVGETHYPYALPDEDPSEWPRISGVHGVFKHLDDVVGGELPTDEGDFFDHEQLDVLRARQIKAARHVDSLLPKLYDLVPPRTWIVVTSDHGELFGEGGYFGHGPIAHEKVFEVPFVEGRIR